MPIGETQRKLGEIVRASVSDCAKPGATFILPWRIEAIQDDLYKGLEECGCGFCPDDDRDTL